MISFQRRPEKRTKLADVRPELLALVAYGLKKLKELRTP
jgi:hypothetical protein